MTHASDSNTQVIKFLYSYGGKILPRRSDGMLRYVGGLTRILAVRRSITFFDLMIKFGESCGEPMSLRCKLPSEDLDLLVSIQSDEELRHMIEEYDRFSLSTNKEVKVRAILSPINSKKKIFSPPSSPVSCFDFPSAPSTRLKPSVTGGVQRGGGYYSTQPYTAVKRCLAPPRGVRQETAKVNGCLSHHPHPHHHHHHPRVYFNHQLHYFQK